MGSVYNLAFNQVGPSPIRQISDIGPVKGSSNPDLACGLDAQKASLVAPANPGSKLSFQWSGGGGSKVFHTAIMYFVFSHIFHSGLTILDP